MSKMNQITLTILLLSLVLFACKEKEKAPQVAEVLEINSDQITEVEIEEEEQLPVIELIMGKFNPVLDSNFIKIDAAHTDKAAIFLQKEAYEQFLEMHKAAAQDGVELKILSATRPFDYQRNIWMRKWNKLLEKGMSDEKQMVSEILKYSSMPGTSRHHWGSDIDLNYLSNHYFTSGKGQVIYEWLTKHAHEYGFCQPYTPKDDERPFGYEEEKWHWSYMPIAEKYFKSAKMQLRNEAISGFPGAQYAVDLNVVERYVLGIDPKCK